jgi:hypothetical protein
MGEGFYLSSSDKNGNESPKKRARTGSISDHGPLLPYPQLIIEMEPTATEDPVDPPRPPRSVSDSSATDGMDERMLPVTPPAKEDQDIVLTTAFTARLEVGGICYLVPTKWYDSFYAWAKGETPQEPGRVDPVGQLCDPKGNIMEKFVESRDWNVSNEEGWSLIKKWYSFPLQGQCCNRHVLRAVLILGF